MIPFGLSSLMTVSMPMTRRLAKCLVPGYSALYWFNEGAGTTVADYSGNAYDGTLGAAGAAPTWTQYGLSFDGGDNVALPDLPTIRAATIVFYTATNCGPATTARYLFGATAGGSAHVGIALGTVAGTLTNEIVTVLCDTNGRSGWCDAGGSIAAGWHVLTVSFSGAQWGLYLDGAALPVTNAGTPVAITSPTTPKIGAKSDGSIGYTGGIGALITYPFGLTTAQEAQTRGALKAVLTARGATFA